MKCNNVLFYSEYRVGVANILMVNGNSENSLEISVLTQSLYPNNFSGAHCLINGLNP